MCSLVEVSRAGYYRHWRASAPAEEATALRDRLQALALAHRHDGYRRLGPLLRREGWVVNHKRVLRLMREDNLLCLRRRAFVPATTDNRHRWPIYPNLARHLAPMAVNQPSGACAPAAPQADRPRADGSPTSPTSGWRRRSPSWRWCWMLTAAARSGGPWPIISGPSWRWRPCGWRWPAARSSRAGWCTIPTVACSTPAATTSPCSSSGASSRA